MVVADRYLRIQDRRKTILSKGGGVCWSLSLFIMVYAFSERKKPGRIRVYPSAFDRYLDISPQKKSKMVFYRWYMAWACIFNSLSEYSLFCWNGDRVTDEPYFIKGIIAEFVRFPFHNFFDSGPDRLFYLGRVFRRIYSLCAA